MAFTDNFNRADEDLTASANWTTTGEAGSAAVRSNALAVLPATAGAGGMFLCPDQGSADQYVEFTLKSVGDGNSGSFVCCRATADGNNFVGIRITPFFQTDGIEIYRRVSGTLTALQVNTRTAPLDTVLRLEVEGDTWRLLRDAEGVIETGSIGDGGALASNTRQGIISRVGDQNPWLDDFEAGPLVEPEPEPEPEAPSDDTDDGAGGSSKAKKARKKQKRHVILEELSEWERNRLFGDKIARHGIAVEEPKPEPTRTKPKAKPKPKDGVEERRAAELARIQMEIDEDDETVLQMVMEALERESEDD